MRFIVEDMGMDMDELTEQVETMTHPVERRNWRSLIARNLDDRAETPKDVYLAPFHFDEHVIDKPIMIAPYQDHYSTPPVFEIGRPKLGVEPVVKASLEPHQTTIVAVPEKSDATLSRSTGKSVFRVSEDGEMQIPNVPVQASFYPTGYN